MGDPGVAVLGFEDFALFSCESLDVLEPADRGLEVHLLVLGPNSLTHQRVQPDLRKYCHVGANKHFVCERIRFLGVVVLIEGVDMRMQAK